MTLIEMIEEGPSTLWLKERALGRTYQVFKQHGRGYRVDIFYKRTRISTEEQFHSDDDSALRWARERFIEYLYQSQCLPGLGALD